MHRMRKHLLLALLLVAAASAPAQTAGTPLPAPKGRKAGAFSPASQSHRNRGKAYYERQQYADALREFQQVIAADPAQATDYLNLGLALLQSGKYDQALGAFTTAKQMDTALLAADYNLGILYDREGRFPDAEAAIQRVVAADPEDPAAWFNLGSVRASQRKYEPAREAYQHVIEFGFPRAQNFYVVSLFRTYNVLVRLKRIPEAEKYLALHTRYRDRVPDVSVQSAALEGGKYGEVRVPLVRPRVATAAAQQKLSFADLTAQLGLAAAPGAPESAPGGASVAVGDYDGDGRPDLYISSVAGKDRLLRNNPDGAFTDVTQAAGLEGTGGSLTATFADYDNSGHPSLFLAGRGGLQLYRNRGQGVFIAETEKAGLKGSPEEVATAVVPLDADNDGLLDLFVTTSAGPPSPGAASNSPPEAAGAAAHFYRNNGDGTFADVSRTAGLASLRAQARAALSADFNEDGYADLLVVRDDGPPLLYLNQGGARFLPRRASAFRTRAYAAQVSDFNGDGHFDLVLWTEAGYQLLLNRGNAWFVPAKGLPQVPPPPADVLLRGAVADLNGDGLDDLLVLDAQRNWHALVNQGRGFAEVPLAGLPAGEYSGLQPAWFSDPGDLDLIAATAEGKVSVWRKQGPRPRWLTLRLLGLKSNQQGIGAVVELKAGTFYSKSTVRGGLTRIFTGGRRRLDVVRVTWPNAIVQNSLDVQTGRQLELRESERLASSCPLLYVWDGEQFVFLTDVLGMAPLGALAPDGSLLPYHSREYVRLPRWLRPRDGRYLFQFTDEMREVDYFDRVRLVAVDHAPGEEVYANEIYSSAPLPPTLHAVEEARPPLTALDDRGRDVLPLLLRADGKYVAGFERQRILGLAETHSLTLDLGPFPDSAPVALWLRGWVFWADSNTARALSSQPEQMLGPSLQVRDAQGRWVTVIPDLGLPSGTDRTMRVDLRGKFLSSDHHVRIVTSLCIYWDQIFFSTEERPAAVRGELAMLSADLHYRGFSVPRSHPEQVLPDVFDYASLESVAPWDPAPGRYTRYGNVEELVARADDHVVVMSPGDELTVAFGADTLPPPAPGRVRDLFLMIDGWAKDGEPNTVTGNHSGPLPYRGMRQYPYPASERPRTPAYLRYLRRYQTRPAYLLLPPLAP